MSNVPSSSDRDGAGPHSPGASSSYRYPLHRSTSVSSAWSTTDAPHHNQGTSYFPPVSPAPRRVPTRSISAARSLSANDEHDQEDEDSGDSPPEAGGEPSSNNASSDDRNDEAENGPTGSRQYTEDDPLTVKDRQSLMNVDHPFGLPIWKPALYKKSRTVNRNAETALHATPSAHGEGLFHPGNIAWFVLFGWWLAAVCMFVAAILFITPLGGKRYAPLIYGLGWYLLWPFGKYVEGFSDDEIDFDRDVFADGFGRDDRTIRPINEEDEEQSTPRAVSPSATLHQRFIGQSIDLAASRDERSATERTPFTQKLPTKSYGTIPIGNQAKLSYDNSHNSNFLGKAVFWLLLICLVAPLMLLVCLICWFFVITIPMAKLNWALIKHMFQRPDTIRFCATPSAVFVSTQLNVNGLQASGQMEEGTSTPTRQTTYARQSGRLSAGQAAPFGSPSSTILLCTYRAIGFQYYKYTVGGVNIFFVNLMAVVFFAIIDNFVLLAIKNKYEEDGRSVPAMLEFLTGKALIFIVSLASVIPLSYFIGMAVASISAQSSIGMGAVINATFGSIIEIILYGIALTQGKGHLVEGSIVGSLLAGVLLMPGVSMCSGAIRKKEQKFNAKSAGVTSTMLIMAIIGTLTPTLFYQTYGNFQLICDGCPSTGNKVLTSNMPWVCEHCYYEHPDPVHDPFYQTTVKELMFFCATILIFSYLIGLWFSLRTHASQIWQNPQPLMHPLEISVPSGQGRMSIYHRLLQSGLTSSLPSHRLGRKASDLTVTDNDQRHEIPSRSATPVPRDQPPASSLQVQQSGGLQSQPPSPSLARKFQQSSLNPPGTYTPFLDSVNHAVKSSGMQPMQLPEHLTTDDFTRAVAVATVSALRHQQAYSHSPARARGSALGAGDVQDDAGGHGGHDAPSWSRTTSASVLLACTALYAVIAEILVDVVDVILEGSGIDEKFLGLTLFALVPNTTEFMNAMSFAMNGNIALSMEIGSAYALQVCLLQIPAMVAFSAWYDPREMGTVANTFTLIFPRWDVIAIILSIFLLTYTYIEAKSNYHRGSILILSYVVLVAGFYYAPQRPDNVDESFFVTQTYSPTSVVERLRYVLASLWYRWI